MGLPRTFVGFSSTDIHFYRLLLAWKANTHIDFDFTNCQLGQEIDSENEGYIKRKCRERITMAGTFAVLIGKDTRSKHKFVRWEIEVAREKGCRIIGINLDGARQIVEATCPPIMNDIGAIFVPFSPTIVAHALTRRMETKGNWRYQDEVYQRLGY
ncbi:TIR domain-containing protein [Achromobacter sp. MY14]|uniref:TIR domain-containing protein n=1 Tax=unclassified Achromobacter TaxID=2626865 RepID=UPI001E2E9B05|nr:TIR domain-containing protein [Achromobacter sp. MY14]MCD0501256.1 TIR domain-containing protein [Achromobacter sp. MY14]